MSQSSLRFAKIVATPTDTAWSQAYNEGSVFSVLALTKTEDIEPESLNTIGKEVLNIFRSEFFTLEDKSLPELKRTVQKSFEHVPKSVLVSFVVAFNKNDLLYLLVVGGGTVLMKRDGKTGTLLDEKTAMPTHEVYAASGVLESNDTIIIQTQEFVEKIPETTLQEALSLDLPNDIAEALTPKVHNSEQGASAALILSYQGPPTVEVIDQDEEDEEDVAIIPGKKEVEQPPVSNDATPKEELQIANEEKVIGPEPEASEELSAADIEGKPRRFTLPTIALPRRTLLLVSIIGAILILLVGTIIMTKNSQENKKSEELFEKIYTEAQKEYDQGMDLLTLNKSLARDDFLSAQKLLQEGKRQFKSGSDKDKKITELQKKVEAQLAATSGITSVVADKAESSDSPFLSALLANKTAVAAAEDDTNVYLLTPGEVTGVAKSDNEKEALFSNDDGWENGVAVGSYLGNIYILDKDNTVYKFVKSGESYAKSSYFTTPPDLSNAISMTIDGSIFILFSDGTIKKYTKGAEETFQVTDVESPLTAPTQIFTTPDLASLFVLESKSSRIVILDKSGVFEEEIISDVLKNAKAIHVNEDESKIFVLSNNKLFSLPLE